MSLDILPPPPEMPSSKELEIEEHEESEKQIKSNFKIPVQERGWKFVESFHRGSRQNPMTTILWSWTAAAIDSLLIVGGSLILLAMVSFLIQLHFTDLLEFVKSNQAQVALVIFIGFSYAYMVILRLFLGFSLGEWACRLRLGNIEQRHNRLYGWKVLLRTTIVMMSGIFLFPFLSLLFRRDLAGEFSGVSVISCST